MAKYTRKAKGTGEVASIEVTYQSTLGVRTTRALAAAPAEDSCDYLELRSRRLEKPLPPVLACKGADKPTIGPLSERKFWIRGDEEVLGLGGVAGCRGVLWGEYY
ncbi:hypothetical protein ZIOFF_027991 [Zingiber officinale]|uniref:Uncharacterized protein n=1 Tax=Zingiber officinale TaxID=94328 RepID=A0A8J5LEI8_ZINOF|nr:hypothetical protein ZIOFF_027991 [Zingiber officinale]